MRLNSKRIHSLPLTLSYVKQKLLFMKVYILKKIDISIYSIESLIVNILKMPKTAHHVLGFK